MGQVGVDGKVAKNVTKGDGVLIIRQLATVTAPIVTICIKNTNPVCNKAATFNSGNITLAAAGTAPACCPTGRLSTSTGPLPSPSPQANAEEAPPTNSPSLWVLPPPPPPLDRKSVV